MLRKLWCFVRGHAWGKWEHAKYIPGGEQRTCQRCYDTESAQPRLRSKQ